MAIDVIVSS